MKNIVIIGASGYVGSALLSEALNRGYRVKAVVRHPENLNIEDDNLEIVKGDVTNSVEVARLAVGMDAVISAYNPGWKDPDIYEHTLQGYKAIIEGVRKSGVKRLLVVGGAGRLYVRPGVRLLDSGEVPEHLLPGIKGLAAVYANYLLPEKELDWVFLSPSASLVPGQRTGIFRIGKDELLTDAKGESHISTEDFAVAMLNELEHPGHHREGFTVGY